MIRYLTLLYTFLLCSSVATAQVGLPTGYTRWITLAGEHYESKQYKEAGQDFSNAFAISGAKALTSDRFDAACAWALAGNKDSAFAQLYIATTNGGYTGLYHLNAEPDLATLHSDKRWNALCIHTQRNKDIAEVKFIKPVVAILDTVYDADVTLRKQLPEVHDKYGDNTPEMQALWKRIDYTDSVDLVKVSSILDQYGWLGTDKIGKHGNSTLWLVIQHADNNVPIQQKFLTMLRKAVQEHQAEGWQLAMLEDRVALHEGRKQLYGSQIHGGPDGDKWVAPLEDPDNVDKRRAAVGLSPLAEYLQLWSMKWDVDEYKKKLPEIERKEKR